MSSDPIHHRPVPRWVHVWCIFTVVVTIILLALGGIVTTFRVGMADPVWPTTPWFLIVTDWQEPRPGFLIEHAHRFAGYIVGCLVIVMASAMYLKGSSSLGQLGAVCLLAVIVQGLLGGVRVIKNAIAGTELAALHGCFAQLVMCLLVSAAVLTAAPSDKPRIPEADRRRIRGQALVLTMVVFVQLIWGALIRHTPTPLYQRSHLFTAFCVVAVVMWMVVSIYTIPVVKQRLRITAIVMAHLLVLQVMLGIEAWIGKFHTSVLPELQKITAHHAVIRTAHVLVGTGVLVTAWVMVLQTREAVSAGDSLEPIRETTA